MKNTLIIICLLFISMNAFSQGDNYELVWSDEFEGNGAIDNSKWHHQTQLPNGYSWFNNEIQHYTNREDNSFVSNGTLKIVAKEENFTDQGVTMTHTSARLNSKFAFTYGYVAIRARLPVGQGTWPAIWTLGQNINETGGFWNPTHGTTGWPACGEMDIMEHWGSNQNFVQSATHTPSSSGNTINKGGRNLSTASTDFHVYSMEWTPDELIFRVDDDIHYIYEPATQNSSTWPFDLNQYLLLNVAILPEVSPAFIQSAMEIDYVRVYQDAALSLNEITETSSFLVAPNPVGEIMNVRIDPELMGGQATLYSLVGQKLTTLTVQDQNLAVNMSNYSRGVYFFTIEIQDRSYTQRIIKK